MKNIVCVQFNVKRKIIIDIICRSWIFHSRLWYWPPACTPKDEVETGGGVEDTRLEAKAVDPKKFQAKDKPPRGQGQGSRTKTQVFSKKKVFKNFFQAISKKRSSKKVFRRKRSSKIFFRWSLLEQTKKKVFANFLQGFWRFPTKFQRFKDSTVLELRTGQFSRTWGFETKAKDFKMCPRGQGRPRRLHLW